MKESALTLDQFIALAKNKTGIYSSSRAWVIEPGFESLYVRYADKYIKGILITGILDIANVTVEEDRRGTGVLTNLIRRLRDDYPMMPLHVENALAPRFKNHLKKLGFVENQKDCFFLSSDTKIVR